MILRILKWAAAAFVVFILCFGPLSVYLRETEDLTDARPDYGQVFTTRTGDIFFQTHGPIDGQPLVLAHGSGAWSQFWEDGIPALTQAGYRVIAFDMPPMGYSGPASSSNYSRYGQYMRLYEWFDSMQVKPIIIGHSFGAGPVVEVALRSPDQVAGMVIVAGALKVNAPEGQRPPAILRPLWVRKLIVSLTATKPAFTHKMLSMFVHRKDAITDRHIEILQQPLSVKGTTHNIAVWLPSLLETPRVVVSITEDAYRKFPKPAALIWGDEDTVTPLEQGQHLQSLLPNSTLTVLPDVGHIPHIEAPEIFNPALLSALSNLGLGD